MANIKLKDAFGAETVFHGIKQLKIPDTDGGAAEFNLEAMTQEKTVEIIQNGTAEILPDEGYDGLSKVTANVNILPKLESREVTLTQNLSTTTFSHSEGYDGLKSLTVTVETPISTPLPPQTKFVDLSMAAGDQSVQADDGYSLSVVILRKPDTLLPENIKKDVAIAGVTGTLEATGGSAEAPDLSEWGDAEGKGCIIASPDRLRLQIWSGQNQFSWLDQGYPQCLINAGSCVPAISSKLDELCAELMTERKSEFEAIFAGATHALFMDRLCEIPQIADSDPKSWEGLRQVLYRALPAVLNDQWSRDCMNTEDYITAYSAVTSSWLLPGDRIHFPFVFRPAVEDGEPVPAAYTLQTPTGTMPDYENGMSSYQSAFYFINSGAADGITAPLAGFITGSLTALICWYSEEAQTIPEALMKTGFNHDWSYGDVVLGAGWNITGIGSEATETNGEPSLVTQTVTAETVQAALSARGYYSKDEVPYEEMDSYQQSFFQSVLIQQYKPLGNRSFTIEFDLYGKQ